VMYDASTTLGRIKERHARHEQKWNSGSSDNE